MARFEDDSQAQYGDNTGSNERVAGKGCRLIAGGNQTANISGVLRSILNGATSCRLAVGYFFVEGLGSLLDPLQRLERIDLLIGNVVNRLSEEQTRAMGRPQSRAQQALSDAEFVAEYRGRRDHAALETALNLRQTIEDLPRSDANRETIVALAQWIAEGRLNVRVATRSRLHAKVALAAYPPHHPSVPGCGIMGTSNVSQAENADAGLPGGANLDVLLEGAEDYLALNQWFERHWKDAQDFRRNLFQELGRAWPLADT